MAPCPSREDLLATLHTEGAGRQTTLWRLTGLGEERASSALRPLEQLVTLSPREEGAGGSQFGSVLWNPEGPQTVLGPVTLHCLSLSLSLSVRVCVYVIHTHSPEQVATTAGRRLSIWSLQESDSSVRSTRTFSLATHFLTQA